MSKIEPTNNNMSVYIPDDWLTGYSCISPIYDSYSYAYKIARKKLSEIRKKYVERLRKLGINIISTKVESDEKTIHWLIDKECIPNLSPETARMRREEFIMQIGEGELKKPKTVTLEEYFANPFFPAVFKYELIDNGYDKFLIETEEQLEKIKALFKMHGERFGKKVIMNCVFQQFIKPPTPQATYLRVLMGASGEVIGASLRYQIEDTERREMGGLFEPWFSDPKSEYYLGCKRMFSSRPKDGFIHLSAPKFSDEKSKILRAHGIDPNNAEVPSTIYEPLRRMMLEYQGLFGIACGFDFIMGPDGTWYYLENQISPNTREWGEVKGFRIPNEPLKVLDSGYADWVVNRWVLDLRMRHDELMKCLGLTYTYEAVMRDEEITPKTIPTNTHRPQAGIRRKRHKKRRG